VIDGPAGKGGRDRAARAVRRIGALGEPFRPGMFLERLGVAGTLALFRTRAYRYSDDLGAYVLAEELEERHLRGLRPREETLRSIERVLHGVASGGPKDIDAPALMRREGLDVEGEIAAREPFRRAQQPPRRPEQTILIVGAPRSGTSHLFNLLAYQRLFAHFTSISCWAWPAYNFGHTGKTLLSDLPADVLRHDSRLLRLDPRVIVPSEGEDVSSRAIPCYRHVKDNEYVLTPPRVEDTGLLSHAVAQHLDRFGTERMVIKAPFNTLRIDELSGLYGPSARFVHIHRDGYAAAASIEENGFVYHQPGRTATPAASWAAFVRAALDHEDRVALLRVSFEELVADPWGQLRRLYDWLGIDAALRLPAGPPPKLKPRPRRGVDPVIEELHERLGRPPARESDR
jgi:hypothetical protein